MAMLMLAYCRDEADLIVIFPCLFFFFFKKMVRSEVVLVLSKEGERETGGN